MLTINAWSILAASVASFAIGSIWYSPALFGKQWMSLTQTDTSHINDAKTKGIWKLYATQFVLSLISFSILAFGIAAMQINGAFDGATLGLLIWIGFYATTGVASMLWERKPLKLVLIGTGSVLFSLLVSGAIIGGWR